jgi:hypothetical protein
MSKQKPKNWGESMFLSVPRSPLVFLSHFLAASMHVKSDLKDPTNTLVETKPKPKPPKKQKNWQVDARCAASF